MWWLSRLWHLVVDVPGSAVVARACGLCRQPRQSFDGWLLCPRDDMTDRMPGGVNEVSPGPTVEIEGDE